MNEISEKLMNQENTDDIWNVYKAEEKMCVILKVWQCISKSSANLHNLYSQSFVKPDLLDSTFRP